jgi:hypothetical protein
VPTAPREVVDREHPWGRRLRVRQGDTVTAGTASLTGADDSPRRDVEAVMARTRGCSPVSCPILLPVQRCPCGSG